MAALTTTVSTYHSASVLPYYYNPQEKCTYYMLGKESCKKAESQWADFGGDKDRKDSRPSKTACRELEEETIGLGKPLAGRIRNGLEQTTKFSRSDVGGHHEYITCMNGLGINQTQLRGRFSQLRKNPKLPSVQREKSDIGWVKADDLAQAVLFRKKEGKKLVARISVIYATPQSNAPKVGVNEQLRPCLGGTIYKIINKVGPHFRTGCHRLQTRQLNI